MNILFKAYCRIYQAVFRIVVPLLPWRKPELIEGENSLLKLPVFIKSKGIKKVLIVTDKGISSLGLVEPLKEGLEKEGIAYAFYDKTVPNPTIDNIEEAAALYRENGCEAIIAFGGGSPMDCAKGVGARIARPDKPIPKMKGVLKVLRKLPPLFAIPTTAGTGSEATLAAVITNSETHEKYPINDVVLIPRYAVLDPVLTKGLPKHITSTTGMDALTHAVEAYIGRSNTRETEDMAKKAVKLIFDNLKEAYDNGSNLEARRNMQFAAYYAGVAFTRAYVGYVHAVAHTLGGMYNVPHGLANAVILPVVLEAFGESAHKRLAELADVAGITSEGETDEQKANKFIAAIKEMNAYMQIPTAIKGIKDEDLPILAKRAFKEANPLYPVPRLMGLDEITKIFKAVQE
ncbi:MAG: iron-containing alcohol dehydrogenase [Clostridiales bacterium]|jgi:alcohol dehydrogenase class IV|nr:iron-containing alcohol dehydrogenase [Clostridiales bacterium]HOB64286.1 iron-containing alcohol dehydrogenase [Clostridia bacterium]HOK81220.1 iron-containing alcohol dehydrogenase [Clostridia bacterium]HPO53096.1 iron-containing alcohol dehydrogenase [Clostridia bacterium]